MCLNRKVTNSAYFYLAFSYNLQCLEVCLCCRKQLNMIHFGFHTVSGQEFRCICYQSKDKDKYCPVLKYHNPTKLQPQYSFSSCAPTMSKSWYEGQASKIQKMFAHGALLLQGFPHPCLAKLQAREALTQSCQQPQLLRLWTRVKSSSITNTQSFVFSASPTEVLNCAVKDYYSKTQSAVGFLKVSRAHTDE